MNENRTMIVIHEILKEVKKMLFVLVWNYFQNNLMEKHLKNFVVAIKKNHMKETGKK